MGRLRRSLLVVDDDTAIANLLAQLLTGDGYHVETAPDGRAALDLIARQRFDLIICDVWMPRLDGAGLYRELALSRPDLAHRMVFVTGGLLTPELRQFLERADAPMLQKPFDLERLRALVRSMLARGAA
jgi:CheY-like chemotaxis protein